MSKDWPSKQPTPQGRENGSVEFDKIQAGTPKSGISEAPSGKLADTGPGKGIPANKRTIR